MNIGARLKAKPFSARPKHPRTAARLRVYAKRRKSYLVTKLIVMAAFLLYYKPLLDDMRAEQRRVRDRKPNKLRQRKCRKLKHIAARISRLQTQRTALAVQIAMLEARIAKRELNMKHHATASAGFYAGWLAGPTDPAPRKEDGWAKRYRESWQEARAERQRVDAAMVKQQVAIIQPRRITL